MGLVLAGINLDGLRLALAGSRKEGARPSSQERPGPTLSLCLCVIAVGASTATKLLEPAHILNIARVANTSNMSQVVILWV